MVEFTHFAEDEFLLSPHWTRMVLVTLFAMLPSVFMLAWFHGKPGPDRDSLARTEKVGIPANLVLCAVVLAGPLRGRGAGLGHALGHRGDGGRGDHRAAGAQDRVHEDTRRSSPWDLGPGIGEEESWMSYAVPQALVLDLMADDFFAPIHLLRVRVVHAGSGVRELQGGAPGPQARTGAGAVRGVHGDRRDRPGGRPAPGHPQAVQSGRRIARGRDHSRGDGTSWLWSTKCRDR